MKIPPLRSPVDAADRRERDRLVGNALRLRDEIRQIFIDVASWNDNVRAPGEDPIDPDPDGSLQRILDGIDASLAASWHG